MSKKNANAKNTHLEKLATLSRRAVTLEGISQLLSWDQETYMPENASPARAEQRKLLAELSHAIKTGPEFKEALKSLCDMKTGKIKTGGFSESDAAQVRIYHRDFMREQKLPSSFVQEMAQLSSESIVLWQKAKMKNDFRLFRPNLEKIVEMMKKKADYIGYKEHPYNALMDEYEPGMTVAVVDGVFAEIRQAVAKLLQKRKATKVKELQIDETAEQQMAVLHDVLNLIGFDFGCGRLDLSAHPFSTSYHPTDSRITARKGSDSLIVQILTTLHEAGHSFYEMGLSVKDYGTPLGQHISLGIHESQSRFWETRIGRSHAFWKLFLPMLQKRFKKELGKIKLDDFMKQLNHVQPSLIRTDADEVTYPLHVILRYELEKELVTDKLKVKDLPERWNETIKKLVGVAPKTDREGCLQDIHWSMGAFGYFPTYSLGNVYAAQMFETFSKKHPDWEARVSKGDFAFIREWLSQNVWKHGRRYDGTELIKKITGKALTAKPFIDYLNKKYG